MEGKISERLTIWMTYKNDFFFFFAFYLLLYFKFLTVMNMKTDLLLTFLHKVYSFDFLG